MVMVVTKISLGGGGARAGAQVFGWGTGVPLVPCASAFLCVHGR